MVDIVRIEARAYSYESEILSRVITAVRNLFPADLQEDLKIQTQNTVGVSHTNITLVSASLRGKRHCMTAFEFLIHSLTDSERLHIVHTLSRRIDERCSLFLRFDKQDAYLNKIRLATGNDVVSIRIHLQYFPRCDTALAIQDLRKLVAAD